jgi:hypothetical protein
MSPLRLATLALLIPLLAACAAGGGTKAPPAALSDDEQLTTRPIERWEHLIAKRADQAWEYLSPGYRATRVREDYVTQMTTRPVTWLSATYDSHRCIDEGSFCEVNLKVLFKVMSRQIGVGELQSHGFVTERWIKSGDTWYYVPEDVSG